MATMLEPQVETVDTPVRADLLLASRPFTPAEYLQMSAVGILGAEERLELLEGMIVHMMVRLPEHDHSVLSADEALRRICSSDFYVRSQMAIALADSHPEPDCAVVRGPRSNHIHQFPKSGEIELVIEVSDSTLRADRKLKARIYARAGIPVYWIVNLVERQVEVLSEPTGDAAEPAYAKTTTFKPGDKVPFALAGVVMGEVAVADLLP
jgi:Uma2 family endonuclease